MFKRKIRDSITRVFVKKSKNFRHLTKATAIFFVAAFSTLLNLSMAKIASAEAQISINFGEDTMAELNLIPGIFTYDSLDFTVFTDNYTGYGIMLTTNNTNLENAADSTQFISPITLPSGNTTGITAAEFQNNTYGYTLGDTFYKPITAEATTHGIDLAIKETAGTDSYTITYGALIDTNIIAGEYLRTVNILAIARVNPYIITYNQNTDDTSVEGMPTINPEDGITHSGIVPLSNATPTRTGYKFDGWSTNPSANIADYKPDDNIELDLTTNNDITLYAIWLPSHVRFSFRDNVIPAEYQAVEYLESTGTQIFNIPASEVSASSKATSAYVSLSFVGDYNTSATNTTFAATGTTTNAPHMEFSNASTIKFFPNGSNQNAYSFSDETLRNKNSMSVTLGRKGLNYGERIDANINYTATNFDEPDSFYSFFGTATTPFDAYRMRIYNITIISETIDETTGDILYANDHAYIPVYRVSDGVTGFYNRIKDTFIPTSSNCITGPETQQYRFTEQGQAMTDQVIYYGDQANLKANTFKRTGHFFNGWRLAESNELVIPDKYLFKTSTLPASSTYFNFHYTLFADWRRNAAEYAYEGDCEFNVNGITGVCQPDAAPAGNYVDTGVAPFAEENINRSFDLRLTVSELDDAEIQVNDYGGTFFSVFRENNVVGDYYRGIVMRIRNNTIQLYARLGNSKNETTHTITLNKEDIIGKEIRIFRHVTSGQSVAYYQIDGGVPQQFIDLTNFSAPFSSTITLGAAPTEDSTTMRRFLNGTISDFSFEYLEDGLTFQEIAYGSEYSDPEEPGLTEVFFAEGPCTFNGTGQITGTNCASADGFTTNGTFINTGVYLFTADTVETDFIIDLELGEDYGQNSQIDSQVTLVGSEWPTNSYPGFVLRRNGTKIQAYGGVPGSKTRLDSPMNATLITNVSLMRRNGIFCVSFNGGNYERVATMRNFPSNKLFTQPVLFGAASNNTDTVSPTGKRQIKGTMSNMRIRTGTISEDNPSCKFDE